jgi:hypothetical protein
MSAPSAWTTMRARFPGDILVRFINREANRQCFVRIASTPQHEAATVYDGATIHVPVTASREEHAQVVAAADAAFARDETAADLLEVAA